MRLCFVFLLACFGIIIAAANPIACISKYTSGVDYFPDKVTLDYAYRFSVTYHNSYKEVTVSIPTSSNSTRTVKYYLLQCGAPIEVLPDPSVPVFQVPVKRMVALSATHLPFIEFLSDDSNLVGVSKKEDVSSSDILERIELGLVAEVRKGSLDKKLLLQIEPDVVMTFASGDTGYQDYETLVWEGFPMVLNSDFLEGSLLGRSEWIKFVALFFNQEAIATTEFQSDTVKYTTLKNANLQRSSSRPSVMVGSPSCFNSPSCKWSMTSKTSYLGSLLQDAGATVVETDSSVLTLDAAINLAKSADFWVNLNDVSFNSLDQVVGLDSRIKDFVSVKKQQVFNNNNKLGAYGSNDYWESALDEPGLLLADLTKILDPSVLPDHNLIWYKRLSTSESKATTSHSLSGGVIAVISLLVIFLVIAVALAGVLYWKRNQTLNTYRVLAQEVSASHPILSLDADD